MKKRYHKYIPNSAPRKEQEGVLVKRTSKKSRKKTLKFFLYSLLFVFLLVIGYVLYSSYSAANNIFTGGINLNDLINRSDLKQTDGVTNVLLLGKGGSNHPGGQLTDTIMLVRLRHQDNRVAMISIPRDLYVTIPGNGKAKINEAYSTGYLSKQAGDDKGREGAKIASSVVSEVAGVPVHYYITADFVGFKEIVDTLGGIQINVEKELDDPMYPDEGFTKDGEYYKTDAYDPLHIAAGLQNMNGELALKFVRSRHGTGASDFDRASRQQQVLYALKEKALSLGVLSNVKKVTDIISSVGDHVRVSMTPSELSDFIKAFSSVKSGSIISEVIDNSEDGLLSSSNNGSSVLVPKSGDYKQIHAFVKAIFDSSISKNIKIEVLNGSDVTGQAATLGKTLESAGFNVTKVDNYEGTVEKTTVRDGAGVKGVRDNLAKYIGKFELEGLDRDDVIVVIIGQDYGN